ncbi:MAG: bifunctional riboflavin kinase/FAD synthetase [Bacteroides sp.]
MKVIYDIQEELTQPCVATIGFFDGVHLGHQYLIEQTKAIAKSKGLPSVLITFSVHPRKVMHKDYQPELLSTTKEKIELLTRSGVDYCVMLNFTPELSCMTAHEFMNQVLKEQLHLQVLVIGYDHRFGHNRAEGFEDYCRYGQEIGVEVVKAQAYMMNGVNVSSSVIRLLLQEGEVGMVTKCLGYNYYLDGKIVDGYKIGRKLGFPTANLQVEEVNKLIPADGVYAVKVKIGDNICGGMLNIGHRPTLDNGTNRSIEVHILDFSSDIYNQSMRITFVKRIRGEAKFRKIEDLVAQLHRDEAEIRQALL